MTAEFLVGAHNGCGENPLWDEHRGLLFWCDIPQGHIFSFDPKTNSHRLVAELGQECGAFSLEESGDLLLLFTGDAALLNPDSGEVTPVRKGFLTNSERFNDCIVAPNGTVFAGTVDWSQKTRGGLFHLHTGWDSHRITGNSNCSNGLGWTVDGRGLYWIDSTPRNIWLFDFDSQTGELSNQRLWLHTPEAVPDGMTTDSEGNLWIAFFDGPFVRRYDANANFIEQIHFPARHVTSCIFGGEEMSDLYVTTGGGKTSDAPDNPSGALYRVKTNSRGMKEFRSKMGASL
ncbi:6-deoxy-6-sulfogluconolactonase [Abditibacteriota bacterium]|nr:6-deoxy-6-sulfogluconolactonase [Abditibacteriota bacterium]